MATQVPAVVRAGVSARDLLRCVRCGMPGAEQHHRRSRSIRDRHTHCTCNLITLCGRGNTDGCHGWVHSHPFEARRLGWIVSRHTDPTPVPVLTRQHGGWVLLGCRGDTTPTNDPREE